MNKKEPDKLAQDAAAARAANMSYGKWKAMQEPVKPATRKIEKRPVFAPGVERHSFRHTATRRNIVTITADTKQP